MCAVETQYAVGAVCKFGESIDKQRFPRLKYGDFCAFPECNLVQISGCREDAPEEWTCREGLAEDAPAPMISTKKEISF